MDSRTDLPVLTKPGFFKLTMGLIVLGTMTACGGGGSGSESSPAPVENQQSLIIETQENTVETRQLNGVVEPESVNPVPGFDSPQITTDISDDTVSITVGDLSNNSSERFTLVTEAGTEYTIVINALNASAEALVQQAETLTEITSPQTLASDDLRLLNTVLEIEYLAGRISESEKTSTSTAAINALNNFANTLENEIALLTLALSNYKAGDTPESDLDQRLSAAAAALSDVGGAGEAALDNVSNTLNEMGMPLPADLEATNPLAYVQQADRYSRFMNADYGTFDAEGNFSFSSSYDFFNAVFHYASQ
ncbi:hypothetical protein [Marinobacter halotolerans]|uniref:hypothetical protein n=1 Tax=Marinobacter halotolerans TaxID=1569211 RepID=UPI0012471AF5|nr:hypothetical protein [Marinobacter halotolerans]